MAAQHRHGTRRSPWCVSYPLSSRCTDRCHGTRHGDPTLRADPKTSNARPPRTHAARRVNRKSEPTCPGTANIRAPADIDTTDDNRGGAVTMDSVWIEVVLVVFAIIVNGFFSGSEIALVSARVARLVELRRRGTRGAAPALAALPLPASTAWAQPVALGLVILTITYLSLVVGELTPKAIALRAPEQVSCLVAPVIAGLNRAGGWLVAVLTASTNVLLRILGQGRVQQSPFISEEEVRYLVREGAAKGVFGKVEEELVHNALDRK